MNYIIKTRGELDPSKKWYFDTLEECKKEGSLLAKNNPGMEVFIYECLGTITSEVIEAKFKESKKK